MDIRMEGGGGGGEGGGGGVGCPLLAILFLPGWLLGALVGWIFGSLVRVAVEVDVGWFVTSGVTVGHAITYRVLVEAFNDRPSISRGSWFLYSVMWGGLFFGVYMLGRS